MSRLAVDHRIIFIEEPIFDADAPPRVESRMEGGPGGSVVEVLVPFTPVAAPGFDDAQLSVLLPLIEGALAQRDVVEPMVWLYTPMALPLIANLRPRAVVYDCMDELSAFRFAPAQLRQRENALMVAADLVLCGGPSLYEARVGLHANLHCLPSAVDPVHFSPPRLMADDPLAARAIELQGDFAHPRIGYFGVIDERMNLALVGEMAQARPDWQFVMVGPVVKIDEAALPRSPNLHWLGMQSYAQLPHLLAGWDVCLMPFALNASTRFISPTKTLEYLAGGKPVVSTEVRDVVSLYGSVVRFGVDAPAFIEACEAILTESEASRADWQAAAGGVVTAGTWDVAAHRVRRWLAAISETRHAAPSLAEDGEALHAA